MKKSLIITFFVALATYILIILYYKFGLKVGGPIDFIGFFVLMIPILLTIIIGIIIIVKTTDTKILNIVLYIILTIASLLITSIVNYWKETKERQALINKEQTLYKEVSELEASYERVQYILTIQIENLIEY